MTQRCIAIALPLPNRCGLTCPGERRTVAWFPDDRSISPRDLNVTVVITNVSVEFTKLGSFGTAYQFGSSLVNSQDRAYLDRWVGGAMGGSAVH